MSGNRNVIFGKNVYKSSLMKLERKMYIIVYEMRDNTKYDNVKAHHTPIPCNLKYIRNFLTSMRVCTLQYGRGNVIYFTRARKCMS